MDKPLWSLTREERRERNRRERAQMQAAKTDEHRHKREQIREAREARHGTHGPASDLRVLVRNKPLAGLSMASASGPCSASPTRCM